MKGILWKYESRALVTLYPAFFYLFLFWHLFPYDPFATLSFLEGYHGLPSAYLSVLNRLESQQWLVPAWKIAILGSAIGPQKVAVRWIAFALTLLFLPLQNSFGSLIKANLILYPCLLALCFLRTGKSRSVHTWSLEYLRFQVLIVFFAAGVAKLVRAGDGWLSEGFLEAAVYGDWLKAELAGLPMPPASDFEALGSLLSVVPALVLAMELCCGAGIVWHRARPFLGFLLLLFFIFQHLLFGWFFIPISRFCRYCFGAIGRAPEDFSRLSLPVRSKWPLPPAVSSTGRERCPSV